MSNLSLYAAIFKLSPVGKKSIILMLRENAEKLIKSNDPKDWHEASASLIAAGFFCMSVQDFKSAAAISNSLLVIYELYEKHNISNPKKMRTHSNAILFRTAVRIFNGNLKDLKINYDALQKDLSLVVVEGGQFGKRWKLGQAKAMQLQLYLDWLVLGDNDIQTWRTAKAMCDSSFGNEAIDTADKEWFVKAKTDWSQFIEQVKIAKNTNNWLIKNQVVL